MGGEERATYRLDLEGNVVEVSDGMSDAQEKLRQRMERGQASLKALENAWRRIRGSTTVNIAAAQELKSRLDAQRQSVAALHVEAFKAGTSYEKLSAGAQKAAKAQEELKKKLEGAAEKHAKDRADALSAAFRRASPTVAALKEKFAGLSDFFKKGGTALELTGFAALGLVDVLAKLTIALTVVGVAAAIAFAKFVIEGANAARAAMLLRAGVAGSADNVKALGDQIDLLSSKVPIAKDKLNELAVELRKSGLGGQTLVDTLNAVANATAGAGDQLGNKLKEIVDRSKLTGVLGISPQELLGTGLNFDEVASSLATNLHTSLNDARAALMQGRVKLADGAAAIRTAVEAKFGKINALQMLDIDKQFERFKQTLQDLTKDINLEPLLESLRDFFSLFKSGFESEGGTVTGNALKQLVTMIGQDLVGAVGTTTPIMKVFFEGLVLGALQLENKYLRLRIAFRDAFAEVNVPKMLDMNDAGKAAQAIMTGLTTAVIGLGGSIVVATAAMSVFLLSLIKAVELGKEAGKAISEGLKGPLDRFQGVGASMGNNLKTGFKDAIGWHSPPKFFVEARKASEEAFAGDPIETPIAEPPAQGKPGRSGGPSIVRREYHFHVTSEKAAAAMKEPSFLARLTKTIEEAELEAGMPIEGEPA